MSTIHVSDERIAATLAALDTLWAKYLCPPTLRELADEMGLRSPCAPWQALQEAHHRGMVLRSNGGKPANAEPST